MSEARGLPGVGQIVGLAWSSLITAFFRMTVLFVGVAVLNVALGLGLRWSTENIFVVALPPYVPLAARVPILVGLGIVQALISTVALSCLAVAMHRLILLDETTPLRAMLRKRVWVFALWTIAFQLVCTVGYIPAEIGGAVVLTILAATLLAVATVRFIFVFPAVAIEAPASGPAGRIKASWQQTYGVFWLVVFALIFALLPLVLLTAISEFALNALAAYAGLDTVQSHDMTPLLHTLAQLNDVLQNLVEPFQIALAAGVASWVYMWRQENPREAPNLTQPPHEI